MSTAKFTAIINQPGFLPDIDTEPPAFDNPGDAWGWLASMRREEEDDFMPADAEYSDVVNTLDAYSVTGHGIGAVTGCAPGRPEVERVYEVTGFTVDDEEIDADNYENTDGDLPGDGSQGTWADNGTGVTFA